VEAVTVEQAKANALKARADLKAQEERTTARLNAALSLYPVLTCGD